MRKRTVVVTFRISKELHDYIVERAQIEDVTKTALMLRFLEDGFDVNHGLLENFERFMHRRKWKMNSSTRQLERGSTGYR